MVYHTFTPDRWESCHRLFKKYELCETWQNIIPQSFKDVHHLKLVIEKVKKNAVSLFIIQYQTLSSCLQRDLHDKNVRSLENFYGFLINSICPLENKTTIYDYLDSFLEYDQKMKTNVGFVAGDILHAYYYLYLKSSLAYCDLVNRPALRSCLMESGDASITFQDKQVFFHSKIIFSRIKYLKLCCKFNGSLHISLSDLSAECFKEILKIIYFFDYQINPEEFGRVIETFHVWNMDAEHMTLIEQEFISANLKLKRRNCRAECTAESHETSLQPENWLIIYEISKIFNLIKLSRKIILFACQWIFSRPVDAAEDHVIHFFSKVNVDIQSYENLDIFSSIFQKACSIHDHCRQGILQVLDFLNNKDSWILCCSTFFLRFIVENCKTMKACFVCIPQGDFPLELIAEKHRELEELHLLTDYNQINCNVQMNLFFKSAIAIKKFVWKSGFFKFDRLVEINNPSLEQLVLHCNLGIISKDNIQNLLKGKSNLKSLSFAGFNVIKKFQSSCFSKFVNLNVLIDLIGLFCPLIENLGIEVSTKKTSLEAHIFYENFKNLRHLFLPKELMFCKTKLQKHLNAYSQENNRKYITVSLSISLERSLVFLYGVSELDLFEQEAY